MSNRSTLNVLAEHLGSAFGLLADAFATEDDVKRTLRRLGWFATSIPDGYVSVGSTAANLVTTIQASRASNTNDLATAFKILGLVEDLYKAIVKLTPPTGTDATKFAAQFVEGLVAILIADYLAQSVPTLYSALDYLGVIQTQYSPEVPASGSSPGQPATVTRSLDYGAIPKIFTDPKGIPERAFGWGTTAFDFQKAIAPVLELSNAAGLSASMESVAPQVRDTLQPTLTVRDNIANVGTISFADVVLLGQAFEIAVSLLEAPVEAGHPLPGIALIPLLPQLSQSVQIGPHTVATITGAVAPASIFALFIRPKESPEVRFPLGSGQPPTGTMALDIAFTPDPGTILLGLAGATRLEANGATFSVKVIASSQGTEIIAQVVAKTTLVLSGGDGDGFTGSMLGSSPTNSPLTFGVQWSNKSGIGLVGSGGFSTVIPLGQSIGPLTIEQLRVAVAGSAAGDSPGIVATGSLDFSVELGPVTASVEDIGSSLRLDLQSGNAGRFGVDVGFKFPTGIGISIDAGSVSGGGFITFDEPNGRYFGALELSVYDISVKAFGLIETKFPDGHKGFSFVIVISAEFTPIELGFGFTLNGVGGLLGINRTIDSDGLLTAIRKGELENVLFPHDVVSQAPAIVHDLQTIFPAAEKHTIFGPMAKLAWLELVHGEIGIIIEFPGPRLAIIGTVAVELPTPDEALVDLHFDVGGILDFPKKSFALDASLTKESRVGDFPISGDMAMRLSWGNNPNFALAIGGFNKHFTPPTGFPALKPVTIDLGVHGNPSINLSGYLALTSNTAQTGASLEARISQSGADLYGFVSFDALFVFSPFSFTGTLDGAVGVNFHGAGFSLHFHGQVSGPSPWRISGSVCVSILFWDACVGFTLPPLGNEVKVSLPGFDPWSGSTTLNPDGTQQVPGLMEALSDQKNWGGGRPPGAVQAVTLVAPLDPKDPPLIDPLGSATVRQKVCPLDLKITKFAGTKPPVVRTFHVKTVTIGSVTTVNDPATVSDMFAPGQYQDMKDADLLSSPSFISMPAGFAIQSDAVTLGTSASVGLIYDTVVFNADGTISESQQQFAPSQAHVTTTTKLSAVALFGLRFSGSTRFFNPIGQRRVTYFNEGYVFTSIGTLHTTGQFPLGSPVARPIATTALADLLTSDPTTLKKLQVTPFFNALP